MASGTEDEVTSAQSDSIAPPDLTQRPVFPATEALWERYGSNPFGRAFEKFRAEVPDRQALVWLNGDGEISQIRTYKEFADQIATLMVRLGEEGIKRGDRVILCYPPGVEFIIAFFSCIISGIIAVPVYPPDPMRSSNDIPRFCDIAQTSGAKKALTNTLYRRVAATLSVISKDARWRSVDWLCTDNLRPTASCLPLASVSLEPHDIAFLQVSLGLTGYFQGFLMCHSELADARVNERELLFCVFVQFTSGSTAEPKGVMVTHCSLLHNIHLCWYSFAFPTHWEAKNPEDSFSSHDYDIYDQDEFWRRRQEVSLKIMGHSVRAFSWLPVYHDMGLVFSAQKLK